MENQMISRIFQISIIWFSLLVTGIFAGDIKVKYISSEHIYLDSGKSAGLDIGTILVIKKNNKITAKLEVVFVAENSASCKITSSEEKIKTGDQVEIFSQPTKSDISPAIIAIDPAPGSQTKSVKTDKKKSTARIRGYLGLQWYGFLDASVKNYNFSQPAVRFKISGKGLLNNNLSFDIKLRARHYKRSGRTPENEWRNRIYTFRVSYQNPTSPVQISAGRIISNNISGIGYIDGLHFNHNLSINWYWGFMAGFKPEWQFSGFQTVEKKYGLYLGYQNKKNAGIYFNATLAAGGEYHESTVSREFLYFRSNIVSGKSWNIYHSMEIDINREWRKERAGNSISLSSLYISGRLNVSENVSTQLSYDNRRNYYRYEYMSLADSLFDDAFRQGLRLNIHYNPQKNIRISVNGGLRKRENDTQFTYSYGAGTHIRQLLMKTMSFHARLGAFSNIYTRGVNFNLVLNNRFYSTYSVSLNYGKHYYKQILNDLNYQNQWIRLNLGVDILSYLNFSGFYEYDFGDDQNGHRIFTEIGYRF